MTQDQFEKVRKDNLDLMKGKVLSKTWPHHIVYDIVLKERDGIQVPHVTGRNEKNPKDTDYAVPLDTWLTENGY
jgi:hypothetical protein